MHDASYYWYIIQAIILLTTLIIVFYGYLIYRTIVIYNQKSLDLQRSLDEMRHQQERLILETEIEIREQTFQHISMELHDNVSQLLSLAKLHMNCMVLEQTPENQTRLEDARELLSRALTDISNISKGMDSDMVANQGLEAAIRFEVDHWNRFRDDLVHFTREGDLTYLDHYKSLLIFRIIQEAINNVVKHAQASMVHIMLKMEPEALFITIQDNGVGFDPAYEQIKIRQEKKSGLRNMRLRAEAVGGRFHLESKPSTGTKIEIHIPITKTSKDV